MAEEDPHDFTPHQLDNPLLRHYDEIDEAAKAFAKLIKGEDDPVTQAEEEFWIKAARIACDPPTWDDVDGLTGVEHEALKNERDEGFWRQTKTLRITIITLCFSAIVQGWIQSVSNGANQTMPEYLGLKYDNPKTGVYSWVNGTAIWRFAAINAITYLTAGFFGCWFSDPLQSSLLGRRGAIFAAASLCILASIGAASVSRTWWHLLIWRAILGLGLGAKASVTPIFGAEVSPAHLRGTLVMNWQLFDALGIFCGFSANLIFYWTNQLAWRFQIASACIPAGALVVLIWTIPESPRWLLKKGRARQAFESLCALRPTPLQAATELFFANAQIQRELEYTRKKKKLQQDAEGGSTANGAAGDNSGRGESTQIADVNVHDLGQVERYRAAVAKTSYWSRILQLFQNARTRRSTVASGVVMLGQQLCGVNVLAFYSTVFIQDINSQSTKNIDALWLSWGLGLANFLFTFPAYWWIDKYGRRFLLLATYPGMILSLLAACLSFLGGTGPDADKHRTVRVSVFMFFFILFVSLLPSEPAPGPILTRAVFARSRTRYVCFYVFRRYEGLIAGTVAFAYASEVFPLFNREAGMSFAVFLNLFGAGILTLFVPRAQVSARTFTNHQPTPQQSERVWLNHQAELLGAFTILCTFSMILIYFFVPETKLATTREDKKRILNYISLEELNQIFAVRTKDCWKYYINHVAKRTLNNVLFRLYLRREKLPVVESMHFWSKQRLNRERRRRRDNNEREGEESERTIRVEEVGEKDEGSVVHDEGVPVSTGPDGRSGSRNGSNNDVDIIRRAPPPLPEMSMTGGRIGFEPWQMQGDNATTNTSIRASQPPRPISPEPPDQPDPDSLRLG